MALLTLEGLILRNLRLGDTSRVVTVLSREVGKFSAVAKGVREPKSRFGASLEILSVSSLVVYYRPGRDLQMISEGFLEREHRGLLRSADRYHHGCAALEFLERILEEEEPIPDVYDLTLRAFALMEDAPAGRLGYILRAFQLRVAGWLGYAPRVDGCSICGRAEGRSFGAAEGGLLCDTCAGRAPGAMPVGDETVALLRTLRGGNLPRSPGPDACRELEQIAEGFLTYHIERYRGLRCLRLLAEAGTLRAVSKAPDLANRAP
jgi:DNA repair protein RecO (recombination protein O)